MIGGAIARELSNCSLLLPTHEDLDLTDRDAVFDWFEKNKPQYVINAAAKVGGIQANIEQPVSFLLENLKIQNNVLEACHRYSVNKTLFFGSACSYPKNAPQPIREEFFNTGSPEPTNIWYATAKIAGLKLAEAYNKQYGMNILSVMPTNSYGPGDNFDEQVNHVIPALMKKFYLAEQNGVKNVSIWGTGAPLREFIFVNDLAKIVIQLFWNHNSREIINIGSGKEITIYDLSKKIAAVVGYSGNINFDTSKPDGLPRKALNCNRLYSILKFNYTSLDVGLEEMFKWALHVKKI